MEARSSKKTNDPLAKQLALTECRRLRQDLVDACLRVQDIGQALGVVVRFLAGMSGKLDAMNGKLDGLQSEVLAMHSALKQLTDKPVLEEFKERRDKLLLNNLELRDKVHIPIDGVYAGDNGRFEVSNNNKSFDLMEEVSKVLLSSSGEKTVLLLSGPAGSGKVRLIP